MNSTYPGGRDAPPRSGKFCLRAGDCIASVLDVNREDRQFRSMAELKRRDQRRQSRIAAAGFAPLGEHTRLSQQHAGELISGSIWAGAALVQQRGGWAVEFGRAGGDQ